MTNQITVQQRKAFKCFSCGEPITFGNKWKKNKSGKTVKMPLNIDGSEHICIQEQKEKYQSTDERKNQKENYRQSSRARFLRWWFGFGQYRYKYGYKEEYNKYNRKEYEDRWNQNKQKREEYKSNFYNKNLTIDSALEILEVIKSEIAELTKIEKFRAVKMAYRKMALKFHPDRCKESDAQQNFIKATEAFEFLESAFMGVK